MSGSVCLIYPPFGSIEHPDLGLGLLQANAQRAGFSCRALYPNLDFAERLGLDLYFWLANSRAYLELLGEWVFAGLIFPDRPSASEEFLRRFDNSNVQRSFQDAMPGRDLAQTLRQIRHGASEFIDQVAAEIVSARPRVVGCASSNQQTCAALAILKRVRQLDDSVVTLLGGANCEGPMGLALRRAFPWVDFVVSGEAEEIFPDLLRALFRHGRSVEEASLPEGVIGASRAAAPAGSLRQRAVVADLEAAALPEYGDYFEQLSRSGLAKMITAGLLLETSRGCWWGKSRCNFCGLNGLAPQYRTKSADRVVQEIEVLCERYATRKVMFVDKSLDPRLAEEVLPRLAERPEPFDLFFQARVMDRAQMEVIARGGGRWLTVGIESLHPRLLALMGKGSSVLQNLRVLRSAYELGIRVSYVLMHGFPGEQDEWYTEMGDLLPLLHHLEPPLRLALLRYDRFSRYHEEPQRFGLNLVPRQAYSQVYPLPAELIADFAYHFEDENGSQHLIAERPGFKALEAQWRQWFDAFWNPGPGREPAFLYMLPSPGSLQNMLYDTRACAVEPAVLLGDVEARILEFCDDIRTLAQIDEYCASGGCDPQAVSQALGSLLRRKALLHQQGHYLSLAVRPPQQAYLPVKDFPGGYYFPGAQQASSPFQE